MCVLSFSLSQTLKKLENNHVHKHQPASIPQPALPIFDGEEYGQWSIKTKTLFKSQDLWDLVDKGIAEHEEEARLKESRKKDAKALFFYSASSSSICVLMYSCYKCCKRSLGNSSKKFQGTSKITAVKLQILRHQFETLHIKGNEGVRG